MKRRLTLLLVAMSVAPAACESRSSATHGVQAHSSSIALSPDALHLFVVHPDADSVSIIATATRTIEHEVLLGTSPPAVDATTKRFDPNVEPRALALDSKGTTLYVTGERSGRIYAVDTSSGSVKNSADVCSEPIGVLVRPDDRSILVACSQDDSVVELDADSLSVETTWKTPRKPWALAWAEDGDTLLVTHLLGPGISAIKGADVTTWTVPDVGPQVSSNEPHGQVRGIYDVLVRPGPGHHEIWTPHLMLGTDTPEPNLVFTNTVFPAVSVLSSRGDELARLSVQAADNALDNGAFGDIVSGPHAIAFSEDGKLAAIVDTNSEDLLILDADKRVEVAIVRPLPGHIPEGIVWAGNEIFVQERNTEDVAAFEITRGADGHVSVTLDGPAFPTLATDPMPAHLRAGQKLFFSANSDDVPITQNHWVACATCHIEGRSDAVTWLFAQGPRDTPSNAGGMLGSGFLFRTGDRSRVQDYWQTINVEQGGFFHAGGAQQPLLDEIADFVNYAMPAPVAPRTDAALRAQGAAVFDRVGCASCHSGPLHTDSGSGNAALDLSGPITLHDVGTCVKTGPWPDVAHQAIDGRARAGCAFDTPALRGLWDSAPFLHDGSAATLNDVLPSMLKASAPQGGNATLSDADRAALLTYLKSL